MREMLDDDERRLVMSLALTAMSMPNLPRGRYERYERIVAKFSGTDTVVFVERAHPSGVAVSSEKGTENQS